LTDLFAESLAEEGLRARKKRRTRAEISDVATELFARHGFDEVTMAEIAAAADVSVKTIFNHFGSKEELYFDRLGELREGLLSTITERARGTTVLEAMRRLFVDNMMPFPGSGWRRLTVPEEYERLRSFLAVEEGAPVLRARRLMLGAELVELLAATLAEELGRKPGDAEVQSLAVFLMGILDLRQQVLRAGVLERRPARRLRAEVGAVVNAAFDRLENGFADLEVGEAR
jgi:AcrR family transcriptional regulator